MKHVFVRCNGGHLFQAGLVHCPFDGWSEDWVAAVAVRARALDASREPVTPQSVQRGVDGAVIERILVIEFGAEECVFEGIAPSHLVVNGRSTRPHEAGRSFM